MGAHHSRANSESNGIGVTHKVNTHFPANEYLWGDPIFFVFFCKQTLLVDSFLYLVFLCASSQSGNSQFINTNRAKSERDGLCYIRRRTEEMRNLSCRRAKKRCARSSSLGGSKLKITTGYWLVGNWRHFLGLAFPIYYQKKKNRLILINNEKKC